MQNTFGIIKNSILNENNKKINEQENLEEYLNGFTREELTRMAISHVFVNDDYTDLFFLHNMKNKPKKKVIEYVIEHYEDILKSYVKIMNENMIESLKMIIKNLKKKKFILDYNLSLYAIMYLKMNHLAKIERKKEQVKIFMPEEQIDIFDRLLKDKELVKENKKNNEIITYVEALLNCYGIIPLENLHEFYERQMQKIDKEDLRRIIQSKTMHDDNIYTYTYNEDILVCGIDFYDEDAAISFYENQKGDYRIFTKEEYFAMQTGSYLESFDSYKRLMLFLNQNFDLNTDDQTEIKEMLIMDYISSAQLSQEQADKNINRKLDEMFELTDKDKRQAIKYIQSIYKKYPKWKKRGNI